MQRPDTAIVILNWNGAKLLREFLPSVLAGTNPQDATVIVVDNGSDDNSVEVLQKEFSKVRTILFSTNYGFAGGYNRAIEQLAGEFKYTVLLNSDVAVTNDWIRPLRQFMEQRPSIGAVQPKILSYSDFKEGKSPLQFEYAGASGGFLDKNGYPFCRGRIFDCCETDTGQYDEPMPIFWATGAALMIRTEIYLEAGGLDEAFFAHMEEIDLCWRIHLLGKEIWVVPSSVVYHLGGGSLPAENPRKTYLNFRNNLLLLHKNLPDKTRRVKLFRRRLLDTLAWAKFVFTGDVKNASAVVKAHRDFRKMAKTYREHPAVDLLDERADTQINIIKKRYLKGVRKFSAC